MIGLSAASLTLPFSCFGCSLLLFVLAPAHDHPAAATDFESTTCGQEHAIHSCIYLGFSLTLGFLFGLLKELANRTVFAKMGTFWEVKPLCWAPFEAHRLEQLAKRAVMRDHPLVDKIMRA